MDVDKQVEEQLILFRMAPDIQFDRRHTKSWQLMDKERSFLGDKVQGSGACRIYVFGCTFRCREGMSRRNSGVYRDGDRRNACAYTAVHI